MAKQNILRQRLLIKTIIRLQGLANPTPHHHQTDGLLLEIDNLFEILIESEGFFSLFLTMIATKEITKKTGPIGNPIPVKDPTLENRFPKEGSNESHE